MAGDMNILVIGSGAREHAIVWKLLQNPRVKDVYVAPGNAGTAVIARNLPIQPSSLAELRAAARAHQVELTIVGPEGALAAGIVDEFEAVHLPVFGPTRGAARIESSKAFAKDLMQRHGIPCANSTTFSDYAAAKEYLYRVGAPVVIKAD
ncbi:MAG: phosphoribosylamine--glycine ligase, partial [Chloroflexota bacterium]